MAAGPVREEDPMSVTSSRAASRRAPRTAAASVALALGAGLVAGRLTRGIRDAAQPGSAASTAPRRRETRPDAVHADVTPHHLDSQAPAYSSDSLSQADGRVADGAGPRRAAGVGTPRTARRRRSSRA